MFPVITRLLKWSRKIHKCPYGINPIYQIPELKQKEAKWCKQDAGNMWHSKNRMCVSWIFDFNQCVDISALPTANSFRSQLYIYTHIHPKNVIHYRKMC